MAKDSKSVESYQREADSQVVPLNRVIAAGNQPVVKPSRGK